MKILLDQNLSYRLINLLSDYYTDVAQVGRLGMAQTDDGMIWQYARVHDYILVTYDAYFQERNLVSGNPIKIIWLRVKDIRTDNIRKLLINRVAEVKQLYESDAQSCLEILDES